MTTYIDLPPVPGGGQPSRPAAAPFNWSAWSPWLAVLVLALSFGGYVIWDRNQGPTPPTPPPAPVVDFDPAFVPIGKAYAAALGPDFAKGVAAGRKLAGQSRTMKYDTIAKEFALARQVSFDKILTPALDAVSPSSVADDKLTPAQILALDRALAGIEKGAGGP